MTPVTKLIVGIIAAVLVLVVVLVVFNAPA